MEEALDDNEAPLQAARERFQRAGDWPEAACAENRTQYYAGKDAEVPRADKPDF